ncbi:hypothetical protein STEG23_032053, partial [Scotinomys teguina]
MSQHPPAVVITIAHSELTIAVPAAKASRSDVSVFTGSWKHLYQGDEAHHRVLPKPPEDIGSSVSVFAERLSKISAAAAEVYGESSFPLRCPVLSLLSVVFTIQSHFLSYIPWVKPWQVRRHLAFLCPSYDYDSGCTMLLCIVNSDLIRPA